jgi:decaprenylphospho-beta-D-erythro-pentofuranosid-2-ulose 2-reductase
MIVLPRSNHGSVLVAGATSSIARHVAAALARRGYDLCLAGRDLEEVKRVASDISIRYQVNVAAVFFEASNAASHAGVLEQIMHEGAAELVGAVLCFGVLGEQSVAEVDFPYAREIITVNLTAAVALLTPLGAYFEGRGKGFIGAISSVAGDRGRQSNYVYGAAKGGLAIYLQGMRQRLAKAGVTVTTIKPGFVDTKMTFGLPGMFLVAKPEDVGEAIAAATIRGKTIVYVPGFWRWIMLIIKCIPERVFVKLKL